MSEAALEVSGFALPAPMPDIDPVENEAHTKRLLLWLLAKHRGEVVLLRQIAQYGPYCVRKASEARRALKHLSDNGCLTPLQNIKLKGFVRREAWVVPA